MRVAYGVLWVALVMAACTRPNPAVCCASASDCTSIGVKDQMRTCAAGLVCADHTCTQPQCTNNADCSGATPACDTSTNTCVICVDNSQCSGSTPTCDTSTHSCTGSGGLADAGTDGSVDAHPTLDAPPDAAVCGGSSSCVAAPPPGWNGPAIYNEGATGMTPPACAGDYATTALSLHGGLTGGNATCSCSCGAAAGTTCGSATLAAYLDSACTAIRNSDTLAPNTCSTLDVSSNYYHLAVPNVTGGSCAASLAKNIPPATWSTQFLTCTNSQGFSSAGCAADQLCAPRPSAPFDAQVCIYGSGNVPCPSGSSYSNRFVRYASFSDTRDCSTCSCGAPTGSCGGHVDFRTSTGQGCSIAPKSSITAGQCVSLTLTVNSDLDEYVPGPAPTCAPSTAMVTGSLSPTGATTFCCMTP